MNAKHNGSVRSNSVAYVAPRRNASRAFFICALVLMLAILFAAACFHFSPPWPRILQTVIPMLTLFGLLVVLATKRRNARTIQRKLDAIKESLKSIQ